MNAAHAAAWTAALIDIVKRSGASVQEQPTCDDVALAAEHLGVDVRDLLEAAELEVHYGLVSVVP